MARITDLESIESEQVNASRDLLHLVDVSDETSVDKKITVEKLLAKVPDAGASARGVVNTSAQNIAGVKTFGDGIVVDNIHTAGGLDLTSFTRFVVVSAVPEVANMEERVLYLYNSVGDVYQGYYLIKDGNDRSRGQIGGRSYSGGTGISVNNTTAEISNDLATSGGILGGNTSVQGDLTVTGDIYQQGSSYETHAEKLYTKKDMIYTRDGAQSPMTADDLSGITAKHYDLQGHDGVLAFNNTGVARVGDKGLLTVYVYSTDGETFYEDAELTTPATIPTGVTPTQTEVENQYEYSAAYDDTQPLATRAEASSMVSNGIVTWDSVNSRMVTTGAVETTLQTLREDVDRLSFSITLDNMGGVLAPVPRWLRFVNGYKKSLKIVAGTLLQVGTKVFHAVNDVTFDLTTDVTQAGKDYFVYLNYAEVGGEDSWTLSATVTKVADTSTSRYIGRFHTLCAAVPAGTTMIYPTEQLSSGAQVCLAPYTQDKDPDFYQFYLKSATAASTNQNSAFYTTPFAHPLAGFAAGDILPETVWCLTFRPDTKFEDAMFYDPVTGRAEDIYLQSGTGLSTRSAYGNVTLTRSRTPWSHQSDMLAVGKRLLKDWEFTAASMGSNQGTNIAGSAFPSSSPYSGGHNDTSSRRMVSMWGAEDMCGLLWQWLEEYVGNASADWHIEDGSSNAPFGKQYWNVYQLIAGGDWVVGAACGSRCRAANHVRSAVAPSFGGRGSSRVIRALA